MGTGLPVPQMVWLAAGSEAPLTQPAAPPVCQALVLPFQVSLPGSPGAGMVYLRHSNLPVAASRPATQSRTPLSPPDAPMMSLSLMASGAPVMRNSGWPSETLVSHTTLPLSLSVATMRAGQLAGEMTRLPQNAAPRLVACLSCLGSMRQTIRPVSPEVPSIL